MGFLSHNWKKSTLLIVTTNNACLVVNFVDEQGFFIGVKVFMKPLIIFYWTIIDFDSRTKSTNVGFAIV
jgi:hypothetical protein